MSGWDAITDAPVYMRERGGGGRGECGLKSAISTGLFIILWCHTLRLVYYESTKRELKRRLVNECRCDERLKAKLEESTCLTHFSHTLGCLSG